MKIFRKYSQSSPAIPYFIISDIHFCFVYLLLVGTKHRRTNVENKNCLFFILWQVSSYLPFMNNLKVLKAYNCTLRLIFSPSSIFQEWISVSTYFCKRGLVTQILRLLFEREKFPNIFQLKFQHHIVCNQAGSWIVF